jgi:uncharacterized damage-inducible protein DinB
LVFEDRDRRSLGMSATGLSAILHEPGPGVDGERARAVERNSMTALEGLGGRSDERAMLAGFLDWYRGVVENKVDGLSLEDASRQMTPTGLSPLGVVAHLSAVEVGWFRETFEGAPVDSSWDDHGLFQLHPEDTVESVVGEYREVCAQSRSIVDAASSLDQLSVGVDPFRGNVSLRWILVHLIEETARHAGHLDLMREQIDGRTGD